MNGLLLSLSSHFTYFLYAVINFPPYVFINTLYAAFLLVLWIQMLGLLCALSVCFILVFYTLLPQQGSVKFHLISFYSSTYIFKFGVLRATVILGDCTYRSLIWRPAGKECPRSSVMSLLLRSRVSTETSSLVRLPSILRILLWCLENVKKKKTHKKGIRCGWKSYSQTHNSTLRSVHIIILENITLLDISVVFLSPKEDTPNRPASLNPLSGTKRAEYTEQSGLHPPQNVYFKSFQTEGGLL